MKARAVGGWKSRKTQRGFDSRWVGRFRLVHLGDERKLSADVER